MRKGTKTIRKVRTHNNEYYIYDLEEDIFGKRPRLYAKSEEEMLKKIEQAEEKRKSDLMKQTPKGKGLKEYVLFYFKNVVGTVPSVHIKRLMNLFENAVFGSGIDRNMDEITADEIQEFYDKLIDKYPMDSVKDIDTVLRNTFSLSNNAQVTDFDYSAVPVPEIQEDGRSFTEYIAEGAELDKMLNFCLLDNCQKYKSNELIITFALLTGLSFDDIMRILCKDVDLSTASVLIGDRSFSFDDRTVEWLKKMDGEDKLKISNFSSDDEFLFTKTKATSQTLMLTLKAIAKRCGLPKGITRKSLHKACIIQRLEKGASPAELYKQYGYKSAKDIIKIRDDYTLRKALF